MLKELVLKNRSYRSFDAERKITVQELSELVDLARLCPSSVNLQMLKFVAVHSPDLLEKVQPLTRWAAKLASLKLPPPGHYPQAFIVICGDDRIFSGSIRMKDVGIAAQTLLLGAVEKGLGGCMIGSFDLEALKEVLQLPEYLKPELIVALGKPDEEVRLTTVENGTDYYREGGIHYVPKRALEDILIIK